MHTKIQTKSHLVNRLMLAGAIVFAIVGVENSDAAWYAVALLVVNGLYSLLNFYFKLCNNSGQPTMATIIVSHLTHYLQIMDMIPRPAMHSPP